MGKLVGILLLATFLVIISGCMFLDDKVMEIDEDTHTSCLIECRDLSQKYFCFDIFSTFSEEKVDGNIEDTTCECILLDCLNLGDGDESI